MPRRISIAMFVDACGFRVIEARPWFLERLPHRQRVESIFGYSSACVPAILTGRHPAENDHWSAFYYAPDTSPFRPLRHLRRLPASVTSRGRVRRWLSKGLAKAYGFTGYFQIYDLPFEQLSLFDYSEKRDIFRPGGINRGESIFDELARRGTPHHVSNWRKSEMANIAALHEAIEEGNINFAFLYTASLDALMHDVTRSAPAVDDKLRWYAEQVHALLEAAHRRYDDVRFALFSDHGMCTVSRVVDLVPRVTGTGLVYGRDYAAIHDSTMMRFWFLRKGAEQAIRAALEDGPDGRWVTEGELRAYGAFWEDGRFGHAIFALEPGVLLCPSHMGHVPLAGMHGYRPEHPDSDSALLASFVPRTTVAKITDLHALMLEMVDWAEMRAPVSTRSAAQPIRTP